MKIVSCAKNLVCCLLLLLTTSALEASLQIPSSLVGKLMVGYWNEPGGGVECHYFKNESELIFLDSEEYGVHEYAWNPETGILNDYSFGEYFEISYETPYSGTFALYAENESPSLGRFVIYDGLWDLDGDGVPDGKEVEDGTLPNLSAPPDLNSIRVVHGTVTDQNGSPLSGVQVTAHQYNLDSDSSYSLAWASTDASGKYALEGLDPGAYRIRFNGWADEPPI